MLRHRHPHSITLLPALGLGVGLLTAFTGVGYSPAKLLCELKDDRIEESSGLAASPRSERYFFTHNDSGDKARFFAVARDGRTLATFTVTGAQNDDWEDMTASRDESGRPCLYFGDIGDNAGKRKSIYLYRIGIPEVDPDRAKGTAITEPARRFELQYPDGPRDAETLMGAPDGRLYIVTKSPLGSGVYAAPQPLRSDKVNRLTRVGEIRFVALPATAKSLKQQVSRLLATGGAISPDGSRMVVRTYTDAYEWDLGKGGVAAALKTTPRRILLPQVNQGEAITYTRDSSSLLISTEGEEAPIHILTHR